MTSSNKIYPFAQAALPPNILDDADYSASSITTTTGYVEDTEADAPYMSKAQRQTSAMAAGLGQFIADNQTGTTDVTDDLSPAAVAAMIEDAASNIALGTITTQPQFDNSTKAATTAFVQRALGNLANSAAYAVNTSLTDANIGGIVVPTAPSLAFELPLVAGLPNGAQITFNGNTYGCVISAQGANTILAGNDGAVTALSLEPNDSGVITVINGQWALTGGELHQKFSSAFNGSLSNPGWGSAPGGLILQFGNDNFPGTGIGSESTLITFPNAFPTACVSVVATWGKGGGTIDSPITVYVDGITTHQFTCTAYKQTGFFSVQTPFYWQAIGY